MQLHWTAQALSNAGKIYKINSLKWIFLCSRQQGLLTREPKEYFYTHTQLALDHSGKLAISKSVSELKI